MKVSELVESRKQGWHQLELLCDQLESRKRSSLRSRHLAQFASLYRSACADLAMADAYQLPAGTIRYLHHLVGRAHNQLYRSRRFDLDAWRRELLVNVPRRLFHDGYLRVAFCIFWGGFFASMFLASRYSPVPQFAEAVIGEETMITMEEMYGEPVGASGQSTGAEPLMFAFYTWHNSSIGLRCFAMGLVFGIGGLFATLFNSIFLGAVFGHMSTLPLWDNFFHFVTAHGPFELTAVVLSAAAGMRLGFSLVDTRGFSRIDALRQAAREAMPTMGAALLLFLGAALIEGFVSPSPLPYEFKAAVCAISIMLLLAYFVGLGYVLQGGETPEQET